MSEETNTSNTGPAGAEPTKPSGAASAADRGADAGGASGDPSPRRPRRRRFWLMAGAATAAVASIAACAQHGSGPGFAEGWGGRHGWGHRHGWHSGPMDAEESARRIDKAVEWVLSDVGASAEQKTRVAAIAKQAAAELAPIRDRHRAARREAVDLLAAPAIDRAAIERLRAEQMRSADEASRRLSGALVDIAEALTPEQRAALKERLERRMARRWS